MKRRFAIHQDGVDFNATSSSDNLVSDVAKKVKRRNTEKSTEDFEIKSSKKKKQHSKKQMAPPPIWKPSDFETWPVTKKNLWNDVSNNAETFYYSYCAPGQMQKEEPWSPEEISRFGDLLKGRPPKEGHWGIFSMYLCGRTGKQCKSLFKKLMKKSDQFASDFSDLSYLIQTEKESKKEISSQKPRKLSKSKITVNDENEMNVNEAINNIDHDSMKSVQIASENEMTTISLNENLTKIQMANELPLDCKEAQENIVATEGHIETIIEQLADAIPPETEEIIENHIIESNHEILQEHPKALIQNEASNIDTDCEDEYEILPFAIVENEGHPTETADDEVITCMEDDDSSSILSESDLSPSELCLKAMSSIEEEFNMSLRRLKEAYIAKARLHFSSSDIQTKSKSIKKWIEDFNTEQAKLVQTMRFEFNGLRIHHMIMSSKGQLNPEWENCIPKYPQLSTFELKINLEGNRYEII